MNEIRVVHPKSDKVVYLPDFESINKEAIKILFDKFYDYGNSWTRTNSPKFWMDRLAGEYSELLRAEKPEEFRKEILDLYNVLGMMYELTYDIFSLKQSVQTTTQGERQ